MVLCVMVLLVLAFVGVQVEAKLILVSKLLPLVDWTYDDTYNPKTDHPNMSGYSIKLMKQIMDEAFEDNFYYFKCVHFNEIETMLKNN